MSTPKPSGSAPAVPTPSPEAVLGVENEEGRQRGVREHPEGLGHEDLARALPSQRRPHGYARGLVVPRRGVLAEREPPAHQQGRHRCHGQHAGRQRERRAGRGLDEGAADGHGDHGAHEPRKLLGARRGRAAAVLHVLGHDRAVRGVEGVEPDVDESGRQPQGHVGRAVAQAHRHQPAGGQRRPAGDEGEAAAAAIGPDADRDRHAEAGDRVDGHHRADQRRRVLDPLEQHGQIGGGESAAGAGPDRGERERQQQAGAAEAHRRRGRHARGHELAPGRGAATRRRADSTLTVAVVVPSGTASATSGRASTICARVAATRRTPGRPRWRPRRAAASRRSSRRRLRASRRIASKRPSARVGAGIDLEPEAEVGQVREEELRGVARANLPRVQVHPRPVGAVAAHRPAEGAQALAQVRRVVGVVGRARLRLEAGAHRLDRIDEAVRGGHAQGIERACGHLRCDREGAPPGSWGCRAHGPRCWRGRRAQGPAPAAPAAARWRRHGACRLRRPAPRASRASPRSAAPRAARPRCA